MVGLGSLAIVTNLSALVVGNNTFATIPSSSQLAQVTTPTPVINLSRQAGVLVTPIPNGDPKLGIPGSCTASNVTNRCCLTSHTQSGQGTCPGFVPNQNLSPTQTIDGNTATSSMWCSGRPFRGLQGNNKATTSFQVKLNGVKEITKINIVQPRFSPSLCTLATDYEVRALDAGTGQWVVLKKVTGSSNPKITFDVDIDPNTTGKQTINAQTIELVASKVLDNTGWRLGINEFEVWGREVAVQPSVDLTFEYISQTGATITPSYIATPVVQSNQAPSIRSVTLDTGGSANLRYYGDPLNIFYAFSGVNSCRTYLENPSDNNPHNDLVEGNIVWGRLFFNFTSPFPSSANGSVRVTPVPLGTEAGRGSFVMECNGNNGTVVRDSIEVTVPTRCEVPFSSIQRQLNTGGFAYVTENSLSNWLSFDPYDPSGDLEDMVALIGNSQSCNDVQGIFEGFQSGRFDASAVEELVDSVVVLSEQERQDEFYRIIDDFPDPTHFPYFVGYYYGVPSRNVYGGHANVAVGKNGRRIDVVDPNGPLQGLIDCEDRWATQQTSSGQNVRVPVCVYNPDGIERVIFSIGYNYDQINPWFNQRTQVCNVTHQASQSFCGRNITDWVRANYSAFPDNFISGHHHGVCSGWAQTLLKIAYLADFGGECPVGGP